MPGRRPATDSNKGFPDPPIRPHGSVVRPWSAARGLEQEPGPPLGLVDPVLEQARGRDVAIFVADIVYLAHDRGQALVVVAKFGEHVLRIDIVSVVVENALPP